jgi:competence protein ComEC
LCEDGVVLKITFINVGYGDAILLETGDGAYRILIDGGSAEKTEFVSPASGRIRSSEYLERRGIKKLDLLVISHFHEDHVCGIEPFIMNGGRVGELWTPWLLPRELWGVFPGKAPPASGAEPHLGAEPHRGAGPDRDAEPEGPRKFLAALDSYNRIFERLSRNGCRIRRMTGPCEYPLPGGITAEVLAPDSGLAASLSRALVSLYRARGDEFAAQLAALDRKMNDFSLVLRFYRGDLGVLLTGDACPSRTAMQSWDTSRLKAGVLKLAHHGQADSVSDDFIRAVSPRIVVTCASSDRRYNSANPQVYEEITRIASEQGLVPEFVFTDRISLPSYKQYTGPRSALTLVLDKTITYSFTTL